MPSKGFTLSGKSGNFSLEATFEKIFGVIPMTDCAIKLLIFWLDWCLTTFLGK